ncbi:ribose ABC transporter permease, partial [Vibrio cyclitrophicus]
MSTKTMSKTTETEAPKKKPLISKEWLIDQKSLIALIFLIVVVSFLNPNFFTVDNILNILRQTSVNAIIAVGMTLVILTAGIDLSVGSVLALCGAFAASMIGMEIPVMIAVPTALVAGAALGAISGVIIAKGKVQAFIATLVTMTLLRGVTMVYTDGRPISTGFTDTADAFAWFGTGYAMGIPVPVWIMVVVFAAVWYLLNHTRFGRYIYALGGNESATRLSGIDVDKVKIGVYAICGLLAAVAGIIVA